MSIYRYTPNLLARQMFGLTHVYYQAAGATEVMEKAIGADNVATYIAASSWQPQIDNAVRVVIDDSSAQVPRPSIGTLEIIN